MKVFWTAAAIGQLESIFNYLAQTSPEYALRMVDQLTRSSERIAVFPFSGRMVPEYELNEVRELLQGPYRLIYVIRAEENQVEVLAVIHSSRNDLKPLE